MPAYKDAERKTWFCKFNYENWKGERKTKVKRGFDTKKAALEWERNFLQVQQADMNMEFEQFVEIYFKDKSTRLKERSLESKRIMIRTKIIPYFGKRKMNTVKPADIMKWQNEMINMGYKPTYLRMLQNQVNAVFNHAERFYGLSNNPCKKIDKMGKSNASELNFWTKDEFMVFINSFTEKEEMYHVIFDILFWMGLRIGEVLALTPNDVSFSRKNISVSKTYYRRNKTDYITAPKTESSNRNVSMPNFLAEELKAYMSKIYGLKSTDRIFPIADRAVQKRLKMKTDVLDIKHIRVHDLRHSHVAFLIEKGMQPLIISKRVGHDSVTTTMNIYGHLYPDKQRQLADMLDEEVSGDITTNIVDVSSKIEYRTENGTNEKGNEQENTTIRVVL